MVLDLDYSVASMAVKNFQSLWELDGVRTREGFWQKGGENFNSLWELDGVRRTSQLCSQAGPE